MLHINRTFVAYLDEMDQLTVLVPKSCCPDEMAPFTMVAPSGEEIPLSVQQLEDLGDMVKYVCRFASAFEFGATYWVRARSGERTDVQIGAVVRTPAFDDQFFYEGKLGVDYTKEQTVFRVWAPTATAVNVKLIHPDSGDARYVPLERGERGVWSAVVPGDWERTYYTYVACINRVWREAVDPYATAVSINGEYGVIIDWEKTKLAPSARPLPPLTSPTDAIIYELSIRDFTSHPDSGAAHKGKYLGLSEANTSGPNGTSTGLSYLKELGVTHVQIMPFTDFAGVDERDPSASYNWGYNPLHLYAPEGSYATDPTDPYARIVELKQMIRTLHENGLRVVMDAVYNHVYDREQSSLEKLVPGYYFRYDAYGQPANGTGVGNDIASERRMARRWIVDSVIFWAKEYGINGFRFDLMGVHDIETMKVVRDALDAIDPSILVYGEGWDLPTPLAPEQKATMANAWKLPRIAYFNDRFRDTIKGSTFHLPSRGFALGDASGREQEKTVIAGSLRALGGLFCHPLQSLNYVECHDNHTFWDKMEVANGYESEAIRRKRQKLATAIVLLAQGIPFLHSGQEFYRTKGGDGNSYQAPDEVNWIDWEQKSRYENDVRYVQGLIALRRAHGAFRLATEAEVLRHFEFLEPTPPSVIAYWLRDVAVYGPWGDIIVIHHHEEKSETIVLPDQEEWDVVCDGEQSGTIPLRRVRHVVDLDGIGTWVLVRTEAMNADENAG
ncbi:type I pullulanase [Geobacillus thermodenitrificans]|uniref:type I pullulanase n=1 Tax=Geobacillus thermodenitrificans TaxID=33940 RepID=UPI000C293AA3|nr:type I pullulanase [Geobacillus thermodenitrificans]PJW22384.1 type I pullulanase [Geobacillus thermodenitrificans]